jgi:SAM-dependent methyltransferase
LSENGLGPGQTRLRTHFVQGQKLELLCRDEAQPTVFSLFLANSLRIAKGDVAAVDLGTGSGVLALALARLGVEEVIAVDHSPMACELAEENARRNGVGDRVTVVHRELADFELEGVNLAVCNPPTMPSAGATPGFATGGADPLAVLRLVAAGLGSWLLSSGSSQIALSSLVVPEAVAILEREGLIATPQSSLPIPFRPFYANCYSRAEIDAFLAAGRAVRGCRASPPGLAETITVFSLAQTSALAHQRPSTGFSPGRAIA